MKVLFYGNLLEYTNSEKVYEVYDCSSVRELICKLGAHFGEKLKVFLQGDDNCLFLVNGKGLMMTGGIDTKLVQGDKIEVLPFADAG